MLSSSTSFRQAMSATERPYATEPSCCSLEAGRVHALPPPNTYTGQKQALLWQIHAVTPTRYFTHWKNKYTPSRQHGTSRIGRTNIRRHTNTERHALEEQIHSVMSTWYFTHWKNKYTPSHQHGTSRIGRTNIRRHTNTVLHALEEQIYSVTPTRYFTHWKNKYTQLYLMCFSKRVI